MMGGVGKGVVKGEWGIGNWNVNVVLGVECLVKIW